MWAVSHFAPFVFLKVRVLHLCYVDNFPFEWLIFTWLIALEVAEVYNPRVRENYHVV